MTRIVHGFGTFYCYWYVIFFFSTEREKNSFKVFSCFCWRKFPEMTPYNKISGDPAPQFLCLRSGNGQKKHFQCNLCGWNLYKKHCWVDIMFSKRHFFSKKLGQVVQTDICRTNLSYVYTKGNILGLRPHQAFLWKKAPARRHFLVFVFVYHGTTDPTSK